MCGIAGWVSADRPVARPAFERMTDRLSSRGPDGRGTWYDRGDRVALGHRRLAIVDLSPAGAQPMSLPERGLHLTYNGEIYNHPALRRELEAKGCVYRSRSDSETILHAYATWGAACVERLRGIFAFAIWDAREGRLFAARDQLGVKPFYYRDAPEGLAFASQPGAFLDLPGFVPEIDPDAFLDALAYAVVPGERCAYRGVAKLAPGTTLEWAEGTVRTRRYWAPPAAAEIADEAEAVRLIEAALDDTVAMQLMGDVPVASFLSGGIDSSLVTAIATARSGETTTAFTIGFDDESCDERPFARAAARACSASLVEGALTRAEAERAIDDTVEAFDEPFGIDAALPMVTVARLARDTGIKVVLTGDGADELFAGYRHYDAIAGYYRRYGRATADARAQPLREAAVGLVRGRFDPLSVYRAHNGRLNGPLAAAAAGPALAARGHGPWRESALFSRDRGPVDAAQRCDLETYLPDEILVKVDRATMAFGVEARVPFLDPELVALAFRIDPALHYANGERKALLKRAARRWLPDEILTARKRGFTPPPNERLMTPALRTRMREAVLDGRLASAGYLRRDGLERALSRLARPQRALLLLYLLERWAQRWVFSPDDVRVAAQ